MSSVIEEITKLSLKKYDPNGIHNVYDKWAHIAKDAYDSDLEPVDFNNIEHVVFSGMGGSGTIGDLFSSILSKTNVHTTVVKGYELPKTVDENTLVVITSVSGNTVETITTLESANKKSDIYDYWIEIPQVDEILYPIIEIIPIQLLAYYTALEKKTNPDYPRNLAKSVTVK